KASYKCAQVSQTRRLTLAVVLEITTVLLAQSTQGRDLMATVVVNQKRDSGVKPLPCLQLQVDVRDRRVRPEDHPDLGASLVEPAAHWLEINCRISVPGLND